MKIGRQMLIAPLLMATVAIGAGAIYGAVDYREGQRAEQGQASDLSRLQSAGQTQEALSQMRGSVYRTLVLVGSLTNAEAKTAGEALLAQSRQIEQQVANLAQTSAGDATALGLLSGVRQNLVEYLKRCEKAVELSAVSPNLGADAMGAAEETYALMKQDMVRLLDHGTALRSARMEAKQGRQFALSAALALALLLAGAVAAVVTWRIQRRIVSQLGKAVALGEAVSAGDLQAAATAEADHSNDEIGDLRRIMLQMAGRLQASMQTVRRASDSIGTAALEIATGNNDLSQRTEQAAAALQQTASSMSQLNGTVAQTADAARTANQLAGSATEVAQRGGTVVSQVVATMDEINSSSKRIADIIGTIDGIAFQTNILALNAAVEAARAGEQGRGFAVVASEVRSLAQRSAAAAREIKALIGVSVERVDAGSQLVADAGRTMTEIVASVQRVSDIIGEISSASGEQSGGIGQINGALTNLDRMTQQNAALVEQSAAAAESLREQAASLTQVVGGFKLQGASAGPVTGAAPADSPATEAGKVIQQLGRAARAETVKVATRPAAKPTAKAAAPAAPLQTATPTSVPAPSRVVVAKAGNTATASDDWAEF